mmetsp:Transcript_40495/g.41320  ORF Transcript_40495/g.41320 Transcript_40495/m.41320 type:complete len:200 (-) Transcript_40495:87-686(-)
MQLDKGIPQVNRKIAILGDRAVGKTALIRSFVDGSFIERYEPTIESTVRKMIPFQKICFNTEIVDTAGMGEFYRIKDEFYRLSRNSTIGVDGYILAYSIASKPSFERLRNINNVLFNMLGDPPIIPRIMVGTMFDLKDQRVVTKEQGLSLANEWKIPFIECSAKDGISINDAFYVLMMDIERDNPLVQADTGRRLCVIL